MSDRALSLSETLLHSVERQQKSVLALILIGFGVLFGAMLYELRQSAWTQALTTADNLLGSISREVSRDIATYEGVLQALRTDRESQNNTPIAFPAGTGVLAESGELFVIDRQGAISGRSGSEMRDSDATEAATVLAALDAAPPSELFVSPPVRGSDGVQRIWMALPLRTSDGTMGGAVAATVQLDRWRMVFERFTIGSKSSINLFHADGSLTMRAPFIESRIGDDFSGTNNFAQYVSAASGRFVSTAVIDGVERAYSFAWIDNHPLVLNVALSTQEIFAAFNKSALVLGAAFALLAALLGGLALLLMRELRLRRRSEQRYRDLSSTDALTGLANRRSFDRSLDGEWRRAARDHGRLSLILIDVDHFKAFNDLYGHPAGDFCLARVANAIAEAVGRPADCVARYGGEEFAVLLPGTPRDGSLAVAERIRQAVAALPFAHAGNTGADTVTVSLGVATALFGRDDDPVAKAALVGAADRALYAAKRGGRNRVVQEHVVADADCAPVLPDEAARLSALARYEGALTADTTANLSELAAMAAAIFQAPMAMVSFVGRDRVQFVGRFGTEMESAHREDAFCCHTILGEGLFVVEDLSLDLRFAENPFVEGDPKLRFYAGAPLRVDGDGPALGSICVMDTVPRPPATPLQAGLLKDLTRAAMRRLEERRVIAEGAATRPQAQAKAG